MGFKSNLRRNQATEDAVTIPDGPFAQGTTMHISYMRLRLNSWYGDLSDRERVARMYGPQVSPEQARNFNTTDGGQAGLHFVCLQRTIQDFVTTRNAMNAGSAQLQNPAITDTVNNGINDFIFVLRRGNDIIPERAHRSFPQLGGESGP